MSAPTTPEQKPLSVLALCGSLRKKSMNMGLLRAAVEVAPTDMRISIWDRLREIPPYDADIDTAATEPEAVADLRRAISAADGLLFASPEYNYSIPGVLKNAIDWASRPQPHHSLKGKPAAIMGAVGGISGSMRMQYHLRQVFVFTQTYALLQPEIIIPKAAERFDENVRLTDESTRELIRRQLVALAAWIRLDPASHAAPPVK